MHRDIANQLRSVVSKKKKRYQQQGFDLDLSYVNERVIAMGFPADKFEAIYRNNIDDVVRFFKQRHDGFYKIYNLCREREFDSSKFLGECARYPFDDHNPPEFSVLINCINDVNEFLNRDSRNVVAINCKAGKGRTGVVVCCILLNLGEACSAEAAMVDYGNNRTHNGKGVTIPSQIRYIRYYDVFVNRILKMHRRKFSQTIECSQTNSSENSAQVTKMYEPIPLWLRIIRFEVAPNLGTVCEIEFNVYKIDSKTKIFSSKSYRVTKSTRTVIFNESVSYPFYGDLKFEFIYKTVLGPSKNLCQCWLNTFFIVNQPMSYNASRKMTDSTGVMHHIRAHDAMTNNPDSASLVHNLNNNNDDDNKDDVDDFDSFIRPSVRQTNQPKFHLMRQSKSYQDLPFFTMASTVSSIESEGSFNNNIDELDIYPSINTNMTNHNCSTIKPSDTPVSPVTYTVQLTKPEIDGAHKDKANKIFPRDFSITFIFSNSPKEDTDLPKLSETRQPINRRVSVGNSQFFDDPVKVDSTNNYFFNNDNDNDSMVPQLLKAWSANSKFYLNPNPK